VLYTPVLEDANYLLGAGADASSLLTAGKSLVAVHDWTFLLGPGFVVGVGNGLILGYLMYRSGPVPRGMALLYLMVKGFRPSPITAGTTAATPPSTANSPPDHRADALGDQPPAPGSRHQRTHRCSRSPGKNQIMLNLATRPGTRRAGHEGVHL
jgi:Domain of unknown function (DUF4386)